MYIPKQLENSVFRLKRKLPRIDDRKSVRIHSLRSSILGALAKPKSRFFRLFGNAWLLQGLVAFLLGGGTVHAEIQKDQFSVYGGVFDIVRERHRTFELGMEYKFSPQWKSPFHFMRFRPLLGMMTTAKKSAYIYGGINFDLFATESLVIAPGFAAGWYGQGDGKNLGYPLEFRSGIELSYQFQDQSRLGAHFYHISNAGLGSRNPGTESLVLLYDIPISRGFFCHKYN